jgi:lipoprotein-releasing system ATP-binding protein
LIEVRDLIFGYRRGEPILDGLTQVFAPGRMTGVTGRSGTGKSTLLYLLGMLVTPWSGDVLLDGVDVGGLPDRVRSLRRAHTVGFVFQDAALDPSRTVLDNVVEAAVYADLPRTEAERRGRELMTRFGVDLQERQRPGEVSGGQAQRVALCRALLNRPDVVLADEPTGNLDAQTAQVVLDALVEEAERGGTVVIASHDASVIARCDDVLAL